MKRGRKNALFFSFSPLFFFFVCWLDPVTLPKMKSRAKVL